MSAPLLYFSGKLHSSARCLSVVLRGFGALVFLFRFCILGMPEGSQCYREFSLTSRFGGTSARPPSLGTRSGPACWKCVRGWCAFVEIELKKREYREL